MFHEPGHVIPKSLADFPHVLQILEHCAAIKGNKVGSEHNCSLEAQPGSSFIVSGFAQSTAEYEK